MSNSNSYDSKARHILSNKQILAYLMKETVDEFKDLDTKEIIKLIESGDDDAYIQGIDTRDHIRDDISIIYDLLFTVRLPDSDDRIGLIINIEAQRTVSLPYPLVKRAQVYANDLVARQGHTENGFDYNAIRKVYSIWICINPLRDHRNCINSYLTYERHDVGEAKEDPANYVLTQVVMIYVGESFDFSSPNKSILEYLSLIFVNHTFSEDYVLQVSKNKYDIILNRREAEEMVSMSYDLIELGIEKGIQRGLKQGIEQGIENTIIKLIESGMDPESVFNIIKPDKEIKDNVIKQLDIKTAFKNR